MRGKKNIGFSLVELMVAVSIIGIIVALALPRYQAHKVRGYRAEARVNLGEIAALQGIYRSLHNKYASMPTVGYAGGGTTNCSDTDFKNALGFAPSECENTRYGYNVTGSKTAFTAVAYAPSDRAARWVYGDCSGAGATEYGKSQGDVLIATDKLDMRVCRNIIKYCPATTSSGTVASACGTAVAAVTPPLVTTPPTTPPTTTCPANTCCDASNNVITSCPAGQTLKAYPDCCQPTTTPPSTCPANTCCDTSNNVITSCPAGQTLKAYPDCCQPTTTCPANTCCDTSNNVITSCPAGQTLKAYPDCCQPTTTCPANTCCDTSNNVITSCPAGQTLKAYPDCCQPTTTPPTCTSPCFLSTSTNTCVKSCNGAEIACGSTCCDTSTDCCDGDTVITQPSNLSCSSWKGTYNASVTGKGCCANPCDTNTDCCDNNGAPAIAQPAGLSCSSWKGTYNVSATNKGCCHNPCSNNKCCLSCVCTVDHSNGNITGSCCASLRQDDNIDGKDTGHGIVNLYNQTCGGVGFYLGKLENIPLSACKCDDICVSRGTDVSKLQDQCSSISGVMYNGVETIGGVTITIQTPICVSAWSGTVGNCYYTHTVDPTLSRWCGEDVDNCQTIHPEQHKSGCIGELGVSDYPDVGVSSVDASTCNLKMYKKTTN